MAEGAAADPRPAGGWVTGWGVLFGFCFIFGGVWRIALGRAIRSGSAGA